jgi:hypothetical protein
LNKFVDILGATTAATTMREPELRLELAGHHESGPSGFTDIRFSDPIAQAEVHNGVL